MISVIVPVLNEAETLGDCLRSILSQLTEYDELIVVDNGSSDESLRIAETFPVKLLHESRRGRSFARNRGIREARGEWIAFIDADVVLDEHWLSSMRRAIIPHWDAGQGPLYPAGPESFFQGYRKWVHERDTHGTFCHLERSTFYYPLINSAAAFYRKELVLKCQGFEESLSAYEDADLSWKAWVHGGKFCAVPGARARVFWNRGNFPSFWIRSFRMGSGLRNLHRRWNIQENSLWRKPDELNGPLAVLDLVRYFSFTLGYLTGKKDGKKLAEIPESRIRTKWATDENVFILDPAVRIVSTPEFTIYKDIVRRKKVVQAGNPGSKSPIELLQRDQSELLENGFLYSTSSRSATRQTS